MGFFVEYGILRKECAVTWRLFFKEEGQKEAASIGSWGMGMSGSMEFSNREKQFLAAGDIDPG